MRTLKKPNREGLLTTEVLSAPEAEIQSRGKTNFKSFDGIAKQNLSNTVDLRIINRYTITAAAVGAVPVPGADVVAVSAIQADLVEELAREHGLKIAPDWGRHVAVILAGSMGLALGARTIFSALKVVPVVGSVLGGGTSAIASAVTTYAMGRVLMEHFKNGGTLNETMVPYLADEAAAYAVNLHRRKKCRRFIKFGCRYCTNASDSDKETT